VILPFTRLKLFKVLKWVTDNASGDWEPGMEPDPMVNLEETKNLNEADIVTSQGRLTEFEEEFGLAPKHMVMFDCDVPVVVVPSSTPGHSHLYFPSSYVSKDMLFVLFDALADAGIEPLPGPFLDFLDPWGNRIEIVSYENVQFTKAPNVLRGMGLTHLSKNEKAIKELTDKGMAPH